MKTSRQSAGKAVNDVESTKFDITGMSCAACSAHIEKAVGKMPGMAKDAVNLLAHIMVARRCTAALSMPDIFPLPRSPPYAYL